MGQPITPEMYATRIRDMLGNAGAACQRADLFEDKVVMEAIVCNIVRRAFLDGLELGKSAAKDAAPGFLVSLYIADGT